MKYEKKNYFSQEILSKGYEIERQLAKKAGRRTLLARDLNSGKLVVIKLLNFSNDFSWEDLKLFEREAQTLQNLEHPTIPRYIDYFELDTHNGKTYALVQSYIQGKSLEEELEARGKFKEKKIKKIARSLLEILVYLHRRQPPLIHRDIKPSNIILAGNIIYLVDFGSVQTLANKGGKTVTVVGTYGYMPPEQFGGAASAASDLYSLGATLITLATGIQPADLPQQGMRIAFEELANLTPEFVEWLRWLIEPSLERRASSAESALRALESMEIVKAEFKPVIRYKPVAVDTDLHGQIYWRSLLYGGGVTTLGLAISGNVVIPVLGTLLGLIASGFVFMPLAQLNACLIEMITRSFFYPLKNYFLYRRITILLSMLVCSAFPVIVLTILSLVFSQQLDHKLFLYVFFPSVICGLSMGVATKSFASWYESESRLKEK